MKLFFVSLICMLSACCTTQTPVCPEQVSVVVAKPIEQDKQKAEEKSAWEYAEIEELVSNIEKSEPQSWTIDVSKKIILAEIHELNIYLHHNSKIFFRMSIFSNGALYLDSEKRDMGAKHQSRLAMFFKKVVEGVK